MSMSKIIAAVPNICEGRDQEFLDGLTVRLNAVPNLMMLDVSVDHVRNRTVFSFTGDKAALFEGGMVLYEESLKHIDMRKHEGDYPRIGAVDVFPFVPLKEAGIEEAVAWSVEFAEKAADRFRIPVYLFSDSARYQARRDIDNIREGEYEGFFEKIKHPRWKPDFGPDEFPADSGATIVGARHPLISFRAFLTTGDEKVAEALCHVLADSKGGLRHVKGHAGLDKETGLALITISIQNFRATPMYRVIETLRTEAKRYGASIRSVEMIGLIPEIALIASAEFYMGIQGFQHENLLERSLQNHLNEKFLFRG
jgi:glutamate formiminotransferase / 5-formyltetrahydrofolate cyclo-ligase